MRKGYEFWTRVSKSDTCWLWTGGKTGKKNKYGIYFHAPARPVEAHRYAYEQLRGLIPLGMELDHLCRVTLCVNPSHLEIVSSKVNTQRGLAPSAMNKRKTVCGKCGNLFDHIRPNGHRACKPCDRNRAHDRYWRNR